MHPSFRGRKLRKFRYFYLIFILNDLRIFIICFIKSFWSKFQRMCNSHKLSFKLKINTKMYIMFLNSRKCWIRHDRMVDYTSKNSLNFSSNSNLFDIDRRQFLPCSILQIIIDKICVVIDSFTNFLATQSNFSMLFGCWSIALNDVVISLRTENLAPESALDKAFLLGDFINFVLDELVGTLS